MTYRCTLDGSATFACVSPYTTPVLGLGRHTFTVAGRGVGGWDLSPDVRTWTIAAAPAPTPVPTATPGADRRGDRRTRRRHPRRTPWPQRRSTKPAPAVLAAPLEPIDISLLYFMNAKKRTRRFATLSVKGVPAGATITSRARAAAARRTETLTSAKGGTLRLAGWLGKRLRTGAHAEHRRSPARDGGHDEDPDHARRAPPEDRDQDALVIPRRHLDERAR